MSDGKLTYDAVLMHVGEFGPYQKRILLLLALVSIPTPFSVYQISFHGIQPPFRCAVPGLNNDTFHIQNEAHEYLINSSIPWDRSENRFSQCHVFESALDGLQVLNGAQNLSIKSKKKVKCSRWVYDSDEYTSSFVADMDLVCDRRVYKVHADSLALSGLMTFSLIGGTFADLLGRKTCLLLGLSAQVMGGILYVCLRSMPAILALTFLLGGCTKVVFLSTFVMVTEFVTPRWRTLAAMVPMYGWTMGLFYVDLDFYLFRDWRVAQLVLTLFPLVFIPYYWLLPESPRWLLIKNRRKEAEVIIRKMARVNGVTLPDQLEMEATLPEAEQTGDCHKDDENLKEPPNKMKFWHICTSPMLIIRYMVITVGWGILSMVYSGMSLNVGNLVEGSMYTNFALQSLMELLAYIITNVALVKCGRKPFYIFNMIIGGIACLGMTGPILAEIDVDWINLTLFCIGKLTTTAALSIVYILASELLPTVIRNSGMGICSLGSKVISVSSPYITNLRLVIPGPIGRAIPLFIFGVFTLAVGLLAFVLPETRNRKLPETIEDARNFRRKQPQKQVEV